MSIKNLFNENTYTLYSNKNITNEVEIGTLLNNLTIENDMEGTNILTTQQIYDTVMGGGGTGNISGILTSNYIPVASGINTIINSDISETTNEVNINTKNFITKGNNSSNKFEVQNNSENTIFNVDSLNFSTNVYDKFNVRYSSGVEALTINNNEVLISDEPLSELLFKVDLTNGNTTTKNNILDDGNGNTSINGDLNVKNANSTSKFNVKNLSNNTIFNINTVNDSIFTKNNLLDNGSGNMYILGDEEIIGRINLRSTDYLNKLLVQNSTLSVVFNVDTLNNIVSSMNNTINGNLLIQGADSSTKFKIVDSTNDDIMIVDTIGKRIFIKGGNSGEKFIVQDSLGSNIFVVDTVNQITNMYNKIYLKTISGDDILLLDGSEFILYDNLLNQSFKVNLLTNAVTTKNNTLDNGSGLIQCSKLLMNTIDDLQTLNIRNSLNSLVFNVDTTNGIVQGKNNILNGLNGEMSVTGANGIEKFVVKNASNVSVFSVDTTTDQTNFSSIIQANGINMNSGTLALNTSDLTKTSGALTLGTSTITTTGSSSFGALSTNDNITLTGTNTKILTTSNRPLNIEIDSSDGTNNCVTIRNINSLGTFGTSLYMYHAGGKGMRFNVDTNGNTFYYAGLNAGTGTGFLPGTTNAFDLGSASFIWNNNHFNNATIYTNLNLSGTSTFTMGSGNITKTGAGTINWGTATTSMGGPLTLTGTAALTMTSGNLSLGTGTVTKTSGNISLGTGSITAQGTITTTNSIQGTLFTATNANNGIVSNRLSLINSGSGAGTGVQITMTGFTGGVTNAFHSFNGTNMLFTPPAGGFFGPGTDNAFAFGGAANRVTQLFSVSATINTSDEREKNTILNSDLGLSFINQLRPVSYKWNVGRNDAIHDVEGNLISLNPVPGVRKHYGLISQEVKSVMDLNNISTNDFAGYIHDVENDKYGLRYSEFIAPMIKAIQELSSQVNLLQTQLNTLLNS